MTMETPICLRLFFLNPLQGDHCTVLGLGAKSVRTPGEPLVARESLKPWFEKMGFNQEKWWLFLVSSLRKIWLTLNGDWMVIEWWLNGVYQFIWLPSPTINGVLTILCSCYSLGWSGDATGDGKIIKSNHRNQHGHGLAGYLLMAMIFMTFK